MVSRNRPMLWILLALCATVSFLAFAYPMYVIRPFRAQGEDELAVALVVRRWGLIVAVAAALCSVGIAVWLWRGSRVWKRLLSVAAVAATIGFAVLTNFNVYEMMFHRIDAPQSMAARDAKLDADDMVLAVRVSDEARAYPIRMIAYHHIVNDVVGREPIVSTY